MDANILTTLIDDGLSQRQIGKRLCLSQTAVRQYLKKFDLRTKHKQTNRKSIPGVCAICGQTNPNEFYRSGKGYMRGWCKKCHNNYAVRRFRNYKAQAVEYKGGKCEKCGYDKCLGSLDFHHKDPEQKDPRWRLMRTWKFENIKEELDKCALLCKNCHGEIHWES